MPKYYLGLDCGTNSVGWAATDEKYNLLKFNGKSEWGARLFDEADTAADRRIHRSGRRRSERAKNRLKLLQRLFHDEMLKTDPEFYQRLRESFFYEEDKKLQQNSKNTLFNDPNFTDKDYHNLYPTIWHLRKAIIHAKPDEHFDLRLYFLAIQHILKHRGHFLIDGSFSQNDSDFQKIYDMFTDAAANYGYAISDVNAEKVKTIICDKAKGKLDKKKQLKELFEDAAADYDIDSDTDCSSLDFTNLAGLIVGSRIDLQKIFDLEESKKFGFSTDNFDEKQTEIEEAIGLENMDLIFAAKQIYDFGLLYNLLGSNKYISDAMVANYEQHKEDLEKLKAVFKPHPEIYQKLFRGNDGSDPESYSVYVGKARKLAGGRLKSITPIPQDKFNQHLKKLFEQVGYSGKLLERAERGGLLPKQRGQAKGTIPQQIHHQELELILKKLEQDFPSFAEEDPNEKSDAKTKSQKIAKIHSFRIPYYVGPLVKRKFDFDGHPVKGGRSEFSWADEEIRELVYPWNFDTLVNKDARAENFIRRMTNECTYLIGEDVLPKASLSYQKYMVLNELNNLKIDGRRIDNDLKRKIYEDGFLENTIPGRNITLNRLSKWLHENGYLSTGQELSGTSETKFLPQLSTYHDFQKILGSDFSKRYSQRQLDEVVEAITILNEEKTMLRHKIAEILNLSEDSDVVKGLAKLSYKDWGKFSNKFLNGIRAKVDGRDLTILEALWDTSLNLMELLGSDYNFSRAIDEANSYKRLSHHKITYRDVNDLYCSPAVKRSVWQAIQIVNELIRVNHHAPAKIFLEVTREDNDQRNKGYTLSRKKDLEQKLKAVKSADAQAILKELGGQEDRSLQSRKLFLYFSQMGRCAYCGKRINLDEINNWQLYDIDHIYPRSLTKDDGITQNLVLVHAEENRDKTNKYPISDDIRKKMAGTWAAWRRAGLITEEKYERLKRATPLTPDELGGFIARQIVETSQSVKAIRDLLERAYSAKVVMVKASQVSDFRHHFGYDKKDKDGNISTPGRPEFIKIRELNDFHHAKDAYLNIVVGNVMNSTFTSDPREWVKKRENQNYTISTGRIFRDSKTYQNSRGETISWPFVKGWEFADSIKIISGTMKQNDVLWTRMSYIESGELFDLQIVSKGNRTDGILPIKQNYRLDPKKYGGYNSIKGAHFALIEEQRKNERSSRYLVSVPIHIRKQLNFSSPEYRKVVKDYISSRYPNTEVIIPIVKKGSLLKINSGLLRLISKDDEKKCLFHNCKQLVLEHNLNPTLKSISNIVKKDVLSRKTYKIDEVEDRISRSATEKVFNAILKILPEYETVPGLENSISKIRDNAVKFAKLDIKEQCLLISEILKIFSCNGETGDLSFIASDSKKIGRIRKTTSLDNYESVYLISQSPTGLLTRTIDLKTVKPKSVIKRKGNKD